MTAGNNKKNIVLLTDCLAGLAAGGAEKQIYELARGLDKNKYDVHVVSLDCSGQAPRPLIETTGSQLHVFRVVRVYGISGLLQGLRFLRFLKQNRIEIIMTYHFSSDLWGTFWGHLAGVKTIISNRRDMGFWRNGLHITAYKLVNPWVNKIVAVSDSIKQMVVSQERFNPRRVEVIYNGIETAERKWPIEEMRRQLKLEGCRTVIMHVANLKPVKGHSFLLEAFAEVSKVHPDTTLVLIGKDEFNGVIQKKAEDLGVSGKVVFLGMREDVPALLSLADICVLPSLSEGMSNSILEYMAAGKPVIATNAGGNPELVHNGINGLLVEKGNAGQLKDALLYLINDKDKAMQMGQAGYEMVKSDFSMRKMLVRYDYLFCGINVLHLISSGGMFGAERVVLNLASKSEGITSYVGALNNLHNPHLEIIAEARKSGLKTVVFNSKGRVDFGAVKEVKKFIADHKIDILHTHNYKSDIIGFFAAKFSGIKWIATNHLWHSSDKKMRLYESIDAFLLNHAHKVIGVSEEIRQNMVQRKLNKGLLEVIDNGVPVDGSRPDRPTALRSSWGIYQGDCVVLIVGRLAKEKGHEVFLKAAAEAIQKAANMKFIIVGDGPLREALEQMAADLGLSKQVVFTGILKDMPGVYASGDIMVNASHQEGLPMTILEAMACRLPIIATDVGAVGQVIQNGKNGVLLKPGDPKALAAAIEDLAQNKDKRLRLAEAAYQDVLSRFSDKRMADRYKQVYYEVAGR